MPPRTRAHWADMAFTPVTLCFLTRTVRGVPQVLLGTKKTGFGMGKIVGLGGHVEPGETDEEFRALLAFLEEAQFDRMGAFAYSPQDGTRAMTS